MHVPVDAIEKAIVLPRDITVATKYLTVKDMCLKGGKVKKVKEDKRIRRKKKDLGPQNINFDELLRDQKLPDIESQ